jgi:predicted membrane protein
MANENPSGWLTPRLVVGLLVVGCGLALMLDNLHMVEASRLIRYWPFGLILIGVAKLLHDEARSSRIVGGLLVVVGTLFVIETFFFVRLDIWRWWPLAIILFGILIVSRAFSDQQPTGKVQVGVVFGGSSSPGPAPLPGQAPTPGLRPGTVEPRISELAIWSGIQRRVSSPAFKRADLTAVMGGIEFDLRQAGTDQGEAVIDVFVLWGGIEITVPPDWAVSNQITPIMGGSDDRSTGTQMSRNRLVVKGVVIMGGVDIKT